MAVGVADRSRARASLQRHDAWQNEGHIGLFQPFCKGVEVADLVNLTGGGDIIGVDGRRQTAAWRGPIVQKLHMRRRHFRRLERHYIHFASR